MLSLSSPRVLPVLRLPIPEPGEGFIVTFECRFRIAANDLLMTCGSPELTDERRNGPIRQPASTIGR